MTIRFTLLLIAFAASACACLTSDSRLVLSVFVFLFLGVNIAMFANAIFTKFDRNLFTGGFSLGCLVFFFADSVATFSLASELADSYGNYIRGVLLDESYTVTIPYAGQGQDPTPPISPARETLLFRCSLAILVGIIAGTVCRLKPKANAE